MVAGLRVLKYSLINAIRDLSFLSDFYCSRMAVDHQKVIANGYYSQYGQDIFLDGFLRYLNQKPSYTFIDIGAYDGVTLSNSQFLDSRIEWSGVCIEANPRVFSQLIKNRTKPLCLNYAVSDVNGTAKFISNIGYSEMLSGLESEFDARHAKRIQYDNKHFGGNSKSISVETKRLDTLLDELNIYEIDLLMVDIEGGEYAVLSGIDFNQVFVSIILVERNYTSKGILGLLRKNGFTRITQLGSDDLYINQTLLN